MKETLHQGDIIKRERIKKPALYIFISKQMILKGMFNARN